MLCDWDREREQIQSRLRQISRDWESSSSNYQTLSIVSPPHAALHETNCKITLLHADVDNYMRKDWKQEMCGSFSCFARISFVMTILSMLMRRYGLAREVSSQQKREVCGRQHGFDHWLSATEKVLSPGLISATSYIYSSFGCFVFNFSFTFSSPLLS